jgi:hypothetical protein
LVVGSPWWALLVSRQTNTVLETATVLVCVTRGENPVKRTGLYRRHMQYAERPTSGFIAYTESLESENLGNLEKAVALNMPPHLSPPSYAT